KLKLLPVFSATGTNRIVGLGRVFSPLPSGLRLLPTTGKKNPAAAHHPGKRADYNDKCPRCPLHLEARWRRSVMTAVQLPFIWRTVQPKSPALPPLHLEARR
ncbi:unnamed protein product, partial [Ectocarpus sp. 6 AP-2014]